MAEKPSPDRSDLESKTREDLQTIAKVKGVDVTARASKASLIEAIMGDVAPKSVTTPVAADSTTRVVRSRRTVATPTDDFDELVSEFAADAKTHANGSNGSDASSATAAVTSSEAPVS